MKRTKSKMLANLVCSQRFIPFPYWALFSHLFVMV